MTRIFVYEYLSGGGAADEPDPAAADLLAMGRSMRDAVAADLAAVADYAVSVASTEASATLPPAARPVTPRPRESAFDFVARQADANHLVWVIAPETGTLLAQLHRRVDPARWLGCDGAAIRVASSKRATVSALAEAGITTPLAFDREPETTRWVVKPDDGAGAVATRLHTSFEAALDDWSQRSRSIGAMTIEPWIDGRALSLSLLCGAGRIELLSINRQQLVSDATGSLAFEGVQIGALPLAGREGRALAALAERIGAAIAGLRGYVGVDLVWHARRGPVVIEVNPRVTCAYAGLSRALGRNLGAEVIALHRRDTPHRDA